MLTIPSAAKQYGITYHTARTDIEKLVEAGVLFELPDVHPRSFVAKELVRAAYGSDDEEPQEHDV